MIAELLPLLLKPIAFPEPDAITSRDQLEVWAKRAKRRKSILLIAYLLGLIACVIVFVAFSSGRQGSPALAANITFAILLGSVCCGPIVLLFVWMTLSSGISQYERLIDRLRASNRVCSVCDTIALYEGLLPAF